MNSPSSPAPDGKPHEEPFGSGAGGEPATGNVAPDSVAAPSTCVVGDPFQAAAVSGGVSLIPGEAPPDYVPVRAMEDMLRVRHEQIHKFGHTLEADRDRPLLGFGQDIESIARAILEDIQFQKSPDRIRRRAVKLGALAMALADRLDSEILEGEE